tara:strand:+ start:1761 stop:2219 length:459 start_codon:yes stop_codon:yes gene_type:complete
MIKINVTVKGKTWLKFIKNPEIYLKQKIKKIQNDKFFGRKKYSLSILLSNTKEIKLLNNKFRKKNKSTDILSFPSQTKKDLKEAMKNNLEIYLGDIIINCKKMNSSSKILFKKHFDVLWIHGLVHLFGYDHKKDNSYKKMSYIEKRFLKKLN